MPTEFIQSPLPKGEPESLVSRRKRNIDQEEESKKFMMKDIMASVEDMICRLPLRSSPISIVGKGRLTFYLDDEKRITSMVVEGQQAD